MERVSMKLAVAAFAFAAMQAFAANDGMKPVVVYTDGLPPNVAEQVKKHAAQGETSLMRYLEATHKQHGLRMEDVTKPRERGAAADAPGAGSKEFKKHAGDIR